MTEFKFDGQWELDIQYLDNSGSQSACRIKFEDDLSEEDEPLKSQIDTYKFIIVNLRNIEETIQKSRTTKEERLPMSLNQGQVTILMSSRENFSYFTVGFKADVQYLFYKNNIRFIERLGNKFNSIERAIQQDDGTLIGKHDFVPIRYSPSSKYGILKPAQEKANDLFEYNLIRFKHNDVFKKLVERNDIKVNGDYKNGSLLASACFMKNNDLVSFLLENGAQTDGALHSCSYWNNNKEAIPLIIEKGANINFQNKFGWTVLHQQASELSSLFQQKSRKLKSGRDTTSIDRKINDRKETIAYLIDAGADPYIEDSMNRNSIQVATNLAGVFKIEIEMFFNEHKKN